MLDLYYHALSGDRRALVPHHDPADPAQYPDTRGTIRLPPRAGRAWYRVALAHRAMHHEAGTFRLRFDDFVRLFAERGLLGACFTALEDQRVDAALARRYPGLASDLRAIEEEELAARPSLQALAPRALLVELLARMSLGWRGDARLPAPLAPVARELVAIAWPLARAEASVEDAADAARRAYAHLVRVPQLLDARASEVVAVVDGGVASEVAIELPEPPRPRLEGDAILEVRVAPVRYRDALDALLAGRETPGPMDQEAIFRISAVDDAPGPPGEAGGRATIAFVTSGPESSLRPLPHEHHELGDEERPHLESGALEPDEPRSFVYPEWDHRGGRYRERWTRVRESVAPAGSTRFYHETLAAHRALVAEIRRQFERVAPETLRRVRAMREGDELDLDAAIDALADLRAGLVPGDNVYVSRERVQRDVAAVLLVDLSSSTADRLEPRPGERYQRILDVEREALVLVSEALLRVGDVFGLYGFSGTGRADVRVVVVKDLDEPFGDAVAARIDALKPIHTTRMGAAIRHAAAKLARSGAGTRLLFVVSDGRPFDLDYGQEYGEGAEVEYAIRDTRAALDEARAAGIRPFLLTVDGEGADYLREMARGIDYEVLHDVRQLPARLLALYRRLTSWDLTRVDVAV